MSFEYVETPEAELGEQVANDIEVKCHGADQSILDPALSSIAALSQLRRAQVRS